MGALAENLGPLGQIGEGTLCGPGVRFTLTSRLAILPNTKFSDHHHAFIILATCLAALPANQHHGCLSEWRASFLLRSIDTSSLCAKLPPLRLHGCSVRRYSFDILAQRVWWLMCWRIAARETAGPRQPAIGTIGQNGPSKQDTKEVFRSSARAPTFIHLPLHPPSLATWKFSHLLPSSVPSLVPYTSPFIPPPPPWRVYCVLS
jgi:hypothetical protein